LWTRILVFRERIPSGDNLYYIKSAKISESVGDISGSAIEKARRARLIAWDIETSGLDWKNNRIGTCQVYIPGDKIYIVLINDCTPHNLKLLLTNNDICKIFHHATFDLRFMTHNWSIKTQNVVCTKIASKILNPSMKDHSLKNILSQYLGITISKEMRLTNWTTSNLSSNQIKYAATDVFYLPRLFDALKYALINCDRWDLAEASFAYLPTRVELDILGSRDVFIY